MATDYEDIFSGEEYKYGTSLAEIRDQQTGLIQDIESGAMEGFRYPGIWSFGEDAPSFEDLTSDERFTDWMSTTLRDSIADDEGMFGGEGYGIPKDWQDLMTDIDDKYSGDSKEGYRQWFKEMGMENEWNELWENRDWNYDAGRAMMDIYNTYFGSSRDRELMMYRTILGRKGQALSPFATQETKIEGLLDRSGTLAGKVLGYETGKAKVREAGLGYGKFGQTEEIEFGGTGIAGSGIREKRLGEYGISYGEEMETLKETEKQTWADIGKTMRGFAEQDMAAVKQHYADVGESLETREGYLTQG